jgi:hypothetical protein
MLWLRLPQGMVLASTSLRRSRNEQAADFKRKCRAALNELVDIGFLQEFAIDGDTVSVQRVSALTRE